MESEKNLQVKVNGGNTLIMGMFDNNIWKGKALSDLFFLYAYFGIEAKLARTFTFKTKEKISVFEDSELVKLFEFWI